MRAQLVTLSDQRMSRSAELCELSARRYGLSDTWGWQWEHLRNAPFFEQHRDLLDKPRGLGYWAWKPWIILNAMSTEQRDLIVYSDAGVEFINNVSHIIDRMDQDIFLFGNNWEHAHWCKRDVIEAIWPFREWNNSITEAGDQWRHEAWKRFGKQCQASVIFFRVSDYSRKFVAEWLKWCLYRQRVSTVCTDEWRYLIDDSPSILPNHPEFREHRHDQAILTTLAYREGIKLHYWPAQYNDGAFVYEKLPEYAQDSYPILFHHHRRRNHEWKNAA